MAEKGNHRYDNCNISYQLDKINHPANNICTKNGEALSAIEYFRLKNERWSVP